MISVQQVFNQFYLDYRKCYTPSPQQAKATWDIMHCKTAALGAHTCVCDECGHATIFYNS